MNKYCLLLSLCAAVLLYAMTRCHVVITVKIVLQADVYDDESL